MKTPACFVHWRLALAWLGLLGPLFYVSYGLANAWASRQAHVPTAAFAWEQAIPFLAWTIYPYWTINAFYAFSLFLARTRHELHRHGLRLLTAQLVAVSCFVLWPLRFSFGQPEVHGPAAWLFDALRSFDQPYNQAPSLHIALAIILWDWYRRQVRSRVARAVVHLWALAICASVLTTFQHHFIDIPTGALLGAACLWLWPLERKVSLPKAWKATRDGARLRLAALYAVAAAGVFWACMEIGATAWWLAWPSASLAIVALCYLGLGARGLGMDRHGRMAGPARWLLAPYRLGASVNAWLWTRSIPAGTQVLPGVWFGRIPGKAEWEAAGRPLLVGLSAELQLTATVHEARCIPMLDLVVPTSAQLQRAVLTLDALYRAEQPLWICCALGFSRSAGTLAGWLCHSGHAASPQQAEMIIRRARPQIVLNDEWRRLLQLLPLKPLARRDSAAHGRSSTGGSA